MRHNITVSADLRESRGKNEARRTRAAGKIPAVVYGTGGDTLAVALDPRQIEKILHSKTGHNTIFRLDVGGQSADAMIVDWQYEPVYDRLLHVDLQRIDSSKRMKVKVPISTHGAPVGVKTEGGMLEIVNREIAIECLPDEIPEHFDLDVTELHIGESLRASQLVLTGSMKLLDPEDTVLAHVITIRGTEAAAPAAEETAAAPEPEPAAPAKGKK